MMWVSALTTAFETYSTVDDRKNMEGKNLRHGYIVYSIA